MRGPTSRKIAAINELRERQLVAGVLHAGKRYHSDDRFLGELTTMILGYQAGVLSGTQNIRTLDNETIALDAEGIVALAAAVGAHRQSVYADSWAQKDSL